MRLRVMLYLSHGFVVLSMTARCRIIWRRSRLQLSCM